MASQILTHHGLFFMVRTLSRATPRNLLIQMVTATVTMQVEPTLMNVRHNSETQPSIELVVRTQMVTESPMQTGSGMSHKVQTPSDTMRHNHKTKMVMDMVTMPVGTTPMLVLPNSVILGRMEP